VRKTTALLGYLERANFNPVNEAGNCIIPQHPDSPLLEDAMEGIETRLNYEEWRLLGYYAVRSL
jgi:hypothetical protein